MPQIRWALGETKLGCFLNNTVTITLKEKVPDIKSVHTDM